MDPLLENIIPNVDTPKKIHDMTPCTFQIFQVILAESGYGYSPENYVVRWIGAFFWLTNKIGECSVM